MRHREDVFSPRTDELAVAIEHDDRMPAAVVDVHIVLAVHGHRRSLSVRPPIRQFTPVVTGNLIGVFPAAKSNHYLSFPFEAFASRGIERIWTIHIGRASSPAPASRSVIRAQAVADCWAPLVTAQARARSELPCPCTSDGYPEYCSGEPASSPSRRAASRGAARSRRPSGRDGSGASRCPA